MKVSPRQSLYTLTTWDERFLCVLLACMEVVMLLRSMPDASQERERDPPWHLRCCHGWRCCRES
eukprot:47706-Pleurochrysis_carterae.AAC.1